MAGDGSARSVARAGSGAITNGSEQGVREGAPGLDDALVAGPDDLEQLEQVLPGGVAVVVAGGPDGVDQPDERVLDVATEQVEVGDEGLGGDVRRSSRGGGAGLRSCLPVRLLALAGAGRRYRLEWKQVQ